MAETNEEADVPGDAITDFAEAGQIDKQPFFEQWRQRVIEVAELGKPPQACGDLWRFGRELEEVRQHAHPALHFGMKGGVNGRRREHLDSDHGYGVYSHKRDVTAAV